MELATEPGEALYQKNDAAPHLTKPNNVSNGNSSPTHGAPSLGGVIDVFKDGSSNANKDTEPPMLSAVAEQLPPQNTPTFGSAVEVHLPKAATSSDPPPSGSPPSTPGVYSSASDPVLVPTLNSRHTSAVGSQWIVPEPNNNQIDKHLSHGVADCDLSKSENVALGPTDRKVSSKLNAEAKGQVSEPSQSSSFSIHDNLAAVRSSSVYNGQSLQESLAPSTEGAPANAESSSKSATDSNVSVGQHVTFPNHFQVPEALRTGLTFGSFDTSFTPTKSIGPGGDGDSILTVESSQESDITAQKHPSNQSVTSNEHEVDHPDHPQPIPNVLEKGPSEGNNASGVLPQNEQVKQDILLCSEGPRNPATQDPANYSLGLMPHMLGTPLVRFEAPESQARDVSPLPNFVGGSSPAMSSPSPSPPVTQTAGVAQNTIPISPQPFPVFRQPYPPNYFPYGPYFSPFFVPPMHQYLGLNGFPQQPSAGNVYLPPAAAAAGIKYSVPVFKTGPNTVVNPTAHVGLPSGYGYGPTPAVSSGSSSTGDDLAAASQLKENHIYTTSGQLSEAPAVWFSGPGQEMSCLPVSSLYNLPPQVTYSPMQAGHGAYAGMYQPSQTIAAPSAGLQPHQATTAGGVETGGQPQSGVYQQQAQMSRNTNF